jgi:hypothetical protein
MRLNFTGRRKIDKQHARVAFHDDPVGSMRGHYFELALDLDSYRLPPDARVFVEVTRGLTLMRFDLGTVAAPSSLSPAQRRLSDFAPDPDGVRFRVKVTQPNGPDAGKLLAEADGIRPDDDGGVTPLIWIAGAELGPTPWRLELIPTDPDLPTLWIHTALGGKEFAKDPVAKPLLLTAAAREVFTALVWEGDHEDEPDHWASLWSRFAKQILNVGDVPDAEEEAPEVVRDWVDRAVDSFAAKHDLANGLARFQANLELEALEEIN